MRKKQLSAKRLLQWEASEARRRRRQAGKMAKWAVGLRGKIIKSKIPDTQQVRIRRFWSFVEPVYTPSKCWNWIGSKNRKGYGMFRFQGRSMASHRASWIINFGAIPNGMNSLHHCDNTSCVNPKHLFLGTQNENVWDMMLKGRSRKANGSENAKAKLNEAKVAQILKLWASGAMGCIAIGNVFKVSEATIRDVVYRKSWRHVPIPDLH